jgi:hypothetical protein
MVAADRELGTIAGWLGSPPVTLPAASVNAIGIWSLRSLQPHDLLLRCLLRSKRLADPQDTKRDAPSTWSVAPFIHPFTIRNRTAAPASSAVPKRCKGKPSERLAT